MPLNIRDVEDTFLTGRAEFEAWLTEFEMMFLAPAALLRLAAWRATLTPEALAAVEAAAPGALELIEKAIAGGV